MGFMTAKDEQGSAQITIRIDPGMIDRADALLDLVAERTGRGGKRADVWREALVAGLRELERQRPVAAAVAAAKPRRRSGAR
jgi:hypothetical protein